MNRLRKPERLNKKDNREDVRGRFAFLLYFPLRVVWLPVEELDVQASILISVSKRRFKRAVKRNRIKRQIREAYRLNKQILLAPLTEKNRRLAIAFIYLADELMNSALVEEKIKAALTRIVEKISTEQTVQPTE